MSKSEWGCWIRQWEFTFFEHPNPFKDTLYSPRSYYLHFNNFIFCFTHWQHHLFIFQSFSNPISLSHPPPSPVETLLPNSISHSHWYSSQNSTPLDEQYKLFYILKGKKQTPIPCCSLSLLSNDPKINLWWSSHSLRFIGQHCIWKTRALCPQAQLAYILCGRLGKPG